ncbi:Uncharacterised protein [Klebsiella pneumoniae]|nr:Uncharacterised protein [Klebsiella pneumoniae]
MLEPGDHTFRIDHVRSVLTPGHEPDGGIGRTTTTGAEYVLRAGRFGSAQSVEARSQAHERFRLSIGIAVEGVAGNLVVKALQLAHVLGHAERVRITGAIGQVFVYKAKVVQHTGSVSHRNGLGFGRLHALVVTAPHRLGNTGTNGGFVLGTVITRHVNRIGNDIVAFRQLLDDFSDPPVLVGTAVHVKKRRQRLTN